ncbi:MAG TPA: type VI secretion system tube protein Hcp, partial [Pantoea sp.]|nr:type VI secretion system tube protein Hcp [Pantoea sp.]
MFHITAQHECRFNFALNSVKPAWPELALPGAHSDIGGGYNPDEHEACFLTRPVFEAVSLSTPDTQTRVYRQTCKQLKAMNGYPAIAPLLNAV